MSLFKKAEESAERLKLFVYGGTGTGKTITALSFPNPVVIDTEKGTTHYGKYKTFSVLKKRDYKSICSALDELLKDPQNFKTFVFDSFTVFYENLIVSFENKMKTKFGNPDYSIQVADYKVIKSQVRNVIHKILSLDMNIVVTARAKTKYAKGEFMKEEGIKPDCPESIPFEFDVNVELYKKDKKSTAVVIKDRTNTLPATFDYTYPKFVEYMGIEGLERDPLVVIQQTNIASEKQISRNTVITFNNKEIKTAGITEKQLTEISSLIKKDESVGLRLLKDSFYVESFLDLKEDEAKAYLDKIKEELSSIN